jgi:hypothetical protein
MAGELNRSGLEWVNADHTKPDVVFHLAFLEWKTTHTCCYKDWEPLRRAGIMAGQIWSVKRSDKTGQPVIVTYLVDSFESVGDQVRFR